MIKYNGGLVGSLRPKQVVRTQLHAREKPLGDNFLFETITFDQINPWDEQISDRILLAGGIPFTYQGPKSMSGTVTWKGIHTH